MGRGDRSSYELLIYILSFPFSRLSTYRSYVNGYFTLLWILLSLVGIWIHKSCATNKTDGGPVPIRPAIR